MIAIVRSMSLSDYAGAVDQNIYVATLLGGGAESLLDGSVVGNVYLIALHLAKRRECNLRRGYVLLVDIPNH